VEFHCGDNRRAEMIVGLFCGIKLQNWPEELQLRVGNSKKSMSLMVKTFENTFSNAWLSRSPQQNWIVETMVGFALWCAGSKLAEIAFVCWKFQEKQAFQVLGSLMDNACKETVSNAWLDRSLSQNWIAETIIGFLSGRLSSKLAEIAFVRCMF
jgi:hypothetical protein